MIIMIINTGSIKRSLGHIQIRCDKEQIKKAPVLYRIPKDSRGTQDYRVGNPTLLPLRHDAGTPNMKLFNHFCNSMKQSKPSGLLDDFYLLLGRFKTSFVAVISLVLKNKRF